MSKKAILPLVKKGEVSSMLNLSAAAQAPLSLKAWNGNVVLLEMGLF